VGQQSLYNHVVVVRRKEIIDFETSQTYPATENNVDKICGPKIHFLKLLVD
jgi:hypothetical protein